MRVAGNKWGPTRCSRDILYRAKGNHLDRVNSDHKVSEMIRRRRRVVLEIGGQESLN
jgi:hypothetical protein